MKKINLNKIFLLGMFFFYYIPILSLIVFSFNSSKSLTNWTGFSFKWYIELLKNEELINAIIMTLIIAILATLFSTIIGTLAAISLSKSRKVIRDAVLNINSLPIVNPEIVIAVSLLLVYVSFGIEQGYPTMLLSHIAFCVPYVLITVYPKVRSLDPNLSEAALDLGATPLQALTKVIVPQIKTSIYMAASIAFTMSFDDFVISYFTAGKKTNISIYLYTLRRGIEPTINALSTVIILFILIKILIDRKKIKKREVIL